MDSESYSKVLGGEPGESAFLYHFQCGRGHSGAPLGLDGGGERGGSGRGGGFTALPYFKWKTFWSRPPSPSGFRVH